MLCDSESGSVNKLSAFGRLWEVHLKCVVELGGEIPPSLPLFLLLFAYGLELSRSSPLGPYLSWFFFSETRTKERGNGKNDDFSGLVLSKRLHSPPLSPLRSQQVPYIHHHHHLHLHHPLSCLFSSEQSEWWKACDLIFLSRFICELSRRRNENIKIPERLKKRTHRINRFAITAATSCLTWSCNFMPD